AVDQSGRLAQRSKPQAVRVLLPPFQAALFSEDTQAQIVLVAGRDLAGPEQTPGAFGEAQHDLYVVVQAPAGHKSGKFSGQLPAIQSGDKTGEIVSVSS